MKLRFFLMTFSMIISTQQSYTRVYALEEFPEGFDALLSRYERVIVKVFMTNCPPCIRLKPIFAAVSQDIQDDKTLFLEVNVKNFSALGAKYAIRSVPTILYFAGNKLVGRHNGYLDAASLRQQILNHYAAF